MNVKVNICSEIFSILGIIVLKLQTLALHWHKHWQSYMDIRDGSRPPGFQKFPYKC